jgi:hypothetical protein
MKNKTTYKYSKTNNGSILEKNNSVIIYSESINGLRRISNYFWITILFFFGIGFFLAGISSYFNRNFIFDFNFSTVAFLPQGILLLFYGTSSILLSFLILTLSIFNMGSGTNVYDLESSVVRLSRRGFPQFDITKGLKQNNIYLVYSFSDLKNIELNIFDGLNPKRILYLNLKDGRKIPLIPSNEFLNLSLLEKRAIFIAKLLKIDFKLVTN